MLLRYYVVVVGMNNYSPINLMQYLAQPNIKLTVGSNLDNYVTILSGILGLAVNGTIKRMTYAGKR